MGIKRNAKGKWSVKGSDNYITYERIIDLTNEDLEVLKQYNLTRAKYIYVGQCSESKIDDRHSKFIWDIKNKPTGNKNIHIFQKTADTYLNIIRFFKEQKNMTQKEVEDYLFRSEDNFKIVQSGLTKEESEELEKNRFHNYVLLLPMCSIVLLKNNDSQVEIYNNIVRLKNNKKDVEFINPTFMTQHENEEYFIIINDIKIKMDSITISSYENEDEKIYLESKKHS
jgi:hypothetical protein